jgi:hypothetical protein
MQIGFGKVDITPRVGVELCGFGPFINRHSIGVRDRLWARAMAVRHGGTTLVLVSCDLIAVSDVITRRVRELVRAACGLPDNAVMVHCTHTHSGPCPSPLIGWGDADLPYIEIVPARIAQACIAAVEQLTDATLRHAEVPCEGIGLNREYDQDGPPLEEVLRDDWRPAKPELTDTTCHVVTAHAGDRLLGFLSYFGCHPVTCCQRTRYIHGDFCGVATNLLEREHPGSIGLFLQGAQGDVNTCVVHKPETESLLALDIIAGRYANAVRAGMHVARPVAVEAITSVSRQVTFSRLPVAGDELQARLVEQEAIAHAPDATDDDLQVGLATVYIHALRRLIARQQSGESLSPATELQAFRIGPLAFLGTPFEIFQAIKNDVIAGALAPIPLVMGLTNDELGYAPDRACTARGGYAAQQVPFMLGSLPFTHIHEELQAALLEIDSLLQESIAQARI